MRLMKECHALAKEALRSLVLCSENKRALEAENFMLHSNLNDLYSLRCQFDSYREGGGRLV